MREPQWPTGATDFQSLFNYAEGMETSLKATQSPLRIRAAPEEVTVRYFGLRDRPLESWFNLFLAVAASALVGTFLRNELWGWSLLLVLLVTLWRTWIPVRYELGPHGITRGMLGRRTRILWTQILNYQVYPGGVLLLPDAVATSLSPLRGMFLPWGSQRERVLANVEYYLAAGMERPSR